LFFTFLYLVPVISPADINKRHQQEAGSRKQEEEV
jgi:hypothetical protein